MNYLLTYHCLPLPAPKATLTPLDPSKAVNSRRTIKKTLKSPQSTVRHLRSSGEAKKSFSYQEGLCVTFRPTVRTQNSEVRSDGEVRTEGLEK